MGTLIKVSKSAVSESELDVDALLTGLGHTVSALIKSGPMLAVVLEEDLNPRQIKKVKKALDKTISNRYVEVFDTEPLIVAVERYKEVIDLCSETLIRNGFEWPPASGQRFSLSTNAQIKWLGLDAARNDAAISYPYRVPLKDNDDFHDIADAAEVHNMYLTAIGTIDAVLSAGTSKKAEIAGEVTKEGARQKAADYLTATGCLELLEDLGP